MTTRLSHIKLWNKALNKWIDFGARGLSIWYKNNVLTCLHSGEEINFNLATCDISNLETINSLLRGFKGELMQQRSIEIQSFREIEDALDWNSKILRSLVLFMGNIMASLRIAVIDKKIVFNPLKSLEKEKEKDRLISGLLQWMFFGLIRKIQSLQTQETDLNRKNKYNQLIATCREIIKAIDRSDNTSDNQLNSLSS